MIPGCFISLMRCARAWLCCCACALAAHAAAQQSESSWLVPGGVRPLRSPVRVLLAGDSLMESLGPQMRDALSGYTNLTLIPIGKKSTGLSRPDFYDWPRVLKQRLAEDKPHVLIMWVGTNDPQNIFGMTGLGEPCSKAWQLAYLGKIREIFHLAAQHKARLMLMGPPVVGEPKLDAQLADINRLMSWACERAGVVYIDTRAILADAHGSFRMQGKLPDGRLGLLRSADRVHITADGNKCVMERVLPILGRLIMQRFSSAAPQSAAARGSIRGGGGISGGSRQRSGGTRR